MAAAPLPRVRPVPVTEPRAAAVVSGVGAPGDTTARGSTPGPGQGVLPLALPGIAGPVGEVPGRARAQPGAQAWARHFAQVAIEVTAGLRQPAQLVRWTSEEVQAALRRRHALARRRGPARARGCVRSVHVAHPSPGVAEVAAVVAEGTRHRAVAFRMEGAGGRWRVTALELG